MDTLEALQKLTYESEGGAAKRLPAPVLKGELPCLSFPALEALPGIRHLISTRLGGVSEREFASLNLSFSRGDDPARVEENFSRVARALDIPEASVTFTHQTHTANVRVITEADKGKGWKQKQDYTDVDALITNVPGICLSAYFADCVPILLVDPKQRAIGVAHSGWKGTVGRIAEKTVRLMHKTYGTDPKDLVAAVGPSIGAACYEVSEAVIQKGRAAFSQSLWPQLFRERPPAKGAPAAKEKKYDFNLRRACAVTLLEAGVRGEHLFVSNLCTACNESLLFSHRASGGKRGNMGAFLYMEAASS